MKAVMFNRHEKEEGIVNVKAFLVSDELYMEVLEDMKKESLKGGDLRYSMSVARDEVNGKPEKINVDGLDFHAVEREDLFFLLEKWKRGESGEIYYKAGINEEDKEFFIKKLDGKDGISNLNMNGYEKTPSVYGCYSYELYREDYDAALFDSSRMVEDLKDKKVISEFDCAKYKRQIESCLSREEIKPMQCTGVMNTNRNAGVELVPKDGDMVPLWLAEFHDNKENTKSLRKLKFKNVAGTDVFVLQEEKKEASVGFKNAVYTFREDFNYRSALNFAKQFKIENALKRVDAFKSKKGRGR